MFKLSDAFIILALIISFVVSGYLWFTGNHLEGIFTAIWIPAILAFATYFKVLGLIAMIRQEREHD